MSLIALLLAGCNPYEETPENDSHWNPDDLMEGMEKKGAVLDFDADTESAGDFENTYRYDAGDLGMANGDIALRDAEFYDEQNLRCITRTTEDGDWYEDCDVDSESYMQFDFTSLASGDFCRAKITRYASLFDDDIDWRFDYQDENPYCRDDEKPYCGDDYDCDGELPVTEAIEGLKDVIVK